MGFAFRQFLAALLPYPHPLIRHAPTSRCVPIIDHRDDNEDEIELVPGVRDGLTPIVPDPDLSQYPNLSKAEQQRCIGLLNASDTCLSRICAPNNS